MTTETKKQSADSMPAELELFDSRGLFVRPNDEDVVCAGWSDEKLARYETVRDCAIVVEDATAELKAAVDAFNTALVAQKGAAAALLKVRPRLTQKDLVSQMTATDHMRR